MPNSISMTIKVSRKTLFLIILIEQKRSIFEGALNHFWDIFFSSFKEKVFFLSGQALTPPLLVAGPLKKKNFFSASLKNLEQM